MPSVDERIEQIFRDCPMLSDEGFKRQHPWVVNVATFLDAAAETTCKNTGKYEPFDRLGVRSIKEYMALLQQGNPEAARIYRTVRDALCFGQCDDLFTEKEISESTARSRLVEAIEKAGCRELIKNKRAESGLLEKTLIGEESAFIDQYRAFHGQLRDGDWLEIEAEVREEGGKQYPLIKIMLYTLDAQKREVAFTTAIGGLGFKSQILYDNL